MVMIYYAGHPDNWATYARLLPPALAEAGVTAALDNVLRDPATVDYIVYAPDGPLRDFTPFTQARAVFSLWAGVEKVVGNTSLTQPLCRMVDPGLTQGMTEWVVGHVMRHHLGLDVHITQQDGIWRDDLAPPLAADRNVAILGLGALGAAAGKALAGFGFQVQGWSRSAKQISGLTCRCGSEGLSQTLALADILILLLPLTPETAGLINAQTLAQLPKGAVVLNPGRGPMIDDVALLAALDRGHLAQATLDVFETEPLPKDHRYWAHPKVTVTPHIASVTRPETAARVLAQNIARDQAGHPLLHQVDRVAGY